MSLYMGVQILATVKMVQMPNGNKYYKNGARVLYMCSTLVNITDKMSPVIQVLGIQASIGITVGVHLCNSP